MAKKFKWLNLEKILDFDLSIGYRKDYIRRIMKKRGFTFLGRGRHRLTYLSPNGRFVLKFPANPEGLAANLSENEIWHSSLKELSNIDYAPCRLIKSAILMMAAVVSSYGDTEGCDAARDTGKLSGSPRAGGDYGDELEIDLPDWVNDIDSYQVGHLPNGKLVAYDYAYEADE
jgi:hypothetical protein